MARGDNFEGAEKILTKLRNLDSSHAYIQHEMSEIRAQVEERSTNRMSKKAQFKKLFQKGVRNRMAIGLALMFLQSFTGVSINKSIHTSSSLIKDRSTSLPTTLPASSKPSVSPGPPSSSSPPASTALQRPLACVPSPSLSLSVLVVARVLFGVPHLAAFLCGTSAGMS